MPIITQEDSYFMEMALKESQKAFENDEIPVGCVVVKNSDKSILCRSHNLTNQLSDPLAHAEHLCVKFLVKNKIPTNNITFYITLEPCAMCAGILERIKAKVIFGYYNDIFGSNKILNKKCGECTFDKRCIEILKKFYETPNKIVIELKKNKKI